MSEISLKVKDIIRLAWDKARSLENDYVGTNHILLVLMREENGTLARILQTMGKDLAYTHDSVEQMIKPGEKRFVGENFVRPLPEIRRVFHLAADKAQPQDIQPEHLLLALTLQSDSEAYKIVQQIGINLDELREQVLQIVPPLEAPIASLASEKPDRFNKFTQMARQALMRSQEEAWIFQQDYIDVGHLFLGLLATREGVATQILAKLNVDREALEQTFVGILCQQKKPFSHTIGLTYHGKKVIQLAVKEARQFKHHYIGTEHLLLGMIREAEERADYTFANAGLKLKEIRKVTLAVLSTTSAHTKWRFPWPFPKKQN